jgi:hypothetical protein
MTRWTLSRLSGGSSTAAIYRGDGLLFQTIVRGPMEGTWAPGYYYVLFEDPDGIMLEVNFVPGAGVRADGSQFNPTTGYV